MNITSPRPQSPAGSARSPQIPQSPALTPSSSVRPSLELPAGARSSSPGTVPGNPTQRRNRAALRDYYNLKAKNTPTLPHNLSRTASITSATSDGTATTLDNDPASSSSLLPPDLDDNPTFSPDAFVQTLLQTSSLRDILRAEATLVSEIKNLDGERKALVYDNYSKLIKATQTIGNMQQGLNARNVGDLERLEPAIGAIGRMAVELDGLTKGRRRSGSEGGGERRKRRGEAEKKELVRWVLGAPKRFEVYVEEGRAEEMESEWRDVSSALDAWQGVKGVEEVRRECEGIMAKAGAEDAG